MAKPRSDKTRHYINNVDLTAAILKYQEQFNENKKKGLGAPQASDYIGKAILMLCEKLTTRWNFAQYSYKSEMKSDAIEDCVNALKSFNLEKAKSNAFNYLSMVAFRACQRRIITERKQNAIKHKNYQHNFHLGELEGSQNATNNSNNEYSNKVIDEFETKHLTKPVKPVKLKENATKSKITKKSCKQSKVKEKPNVQKVTSNPAHRGKPRAKVARKK